MILHQLNRSSSAHGASCRLAADRWDFTVIRSGSIHVKPRFARPECTTYIVSDGMSGGDQDMTNQDLHSGCTDGRAIRSSCAAISRSHCAGRCAEQITYREMGERMARYAAVFICAGLKVGDGVAHSAPIAWMQSVSSGRFRWQVCVTRHCIRWVPKMTKFTFSMTPKSNAWWLTNAHSVNAAAASHRTRHGISQVFSIGPSDFAESMAERAQSIEPLPLNSQGNAQKYRPDHVYRWYNG